MLKKTAIWILVALTVLASALMLMSCEGVNSPGSGGQEAAGEGQAEEGAGQDESQSGGEQSGGKESSGQSVSVEEGGSYDQKEEVAEYLSIYKKLPKNYIKKNEAKRLGWQGGSVEQVAPGKAIGGDHFGNYEHKLPDKKGRRYYECDIDTLGKDSRGPKRMIYSDDGLIYYTGDHYNTFQEMPQSSSSARGE